MTGDSYFQAVFDGSIDAMVIADDQGVCVDVNPSACALFNLTREQLIDRQIAEFLEPRFDVERVSQHSTSTGESLLLRPDGTARIVEYAATANFLPNRHLVIWHDITERKQAEMALRQSEQRLQLVIDATNDAIWDWNLESNALFWSDRVYQFLGLEPDTLEPSYKIIYQCVHPDDRKQFLQVVRKHLEFNHSFRIELRLRRSDGSYGWFLLMGKAVRNSGGRLIRVVGSMSDIGDRKLAEEQLKTSLREKEVLLGEIHHRVKNNLFIIASLLYLQANRSEDKSVREILQDSRNRVESMALVHESLYHSQDFSEINLAEYLQKLSANLLSIYTTQSHAIQFRVITKTDVFINLQQAIPCGLIVNELITNALKHGCPSHIEGEVVVMLEVTSDRQLLLSVANRGDTLPAGFDIQHSQSMGLKLVMTLVKQLKANITVERGNKTVFKIKFSI